LIEWEDGVGGVTKDSKSVKLFGREQSKYNQLEDGAASALVFAGLDLERHTSSFGEGFIDAPVLHGGTF
jgi:hypothetical protein